MMDVFVGVFLLCEAVEDIKTQKLDVLRLGIFAVLAVLLEIFYIRSSPIEVLIGAIFGFVTLGVAWMTKEAIGYGDGAVMVIMGICCGLGRTLQTFVFAVIAMIFVAMVLMIKKGIRFDIRIPFIPCLFIGYLGGLFL